MAEPIILPKDHNFYSHANDLEQLLSPLKRFGITTFTFMRKFPNASQIYLSNKAGWIEDYFTSAFYGQFISQPLSSYKDGCTVIPSNSTLPVFSLARERYDSHHCAVFIKSHIDFTDFYFFSGSHNSHHLMSLYVNHLDIFKRYMLYFQDRAEDILKNANNHKISLSNLSHPIMNESITNIIDEKEINTAISEMRIRKYRFKSQSLSNIVLASREIDVIHCLIKGMTAKESASLLNLSQRTVESYLDNIKIKLSCYSKLEILEILKLDGYPII